MHNFLLLIPFGLFAAYIVVAFLALRHVLGEGGARRARLLAIFALGPGEILRHTYRALIFIVVGPVVLLVAVSSFGQYLEYRASPSCGETHPADCRNLVQLEVSGVSTSHAKSGDETVVDFSGGYGSATFYSDDVSPSSLPVGLLVTAEVWRGAVTAIVIDGRKHVSFGSQSDAWIGIVAGAALLLLGLLWLGIDLAVASMDPDVERSHDSFASPLKRRWALYILLAIFGGLLVFLGLAYIALLLKAGSTANSLAVVYLVGGVLAVPVLVLIFVAWFLRAYLNVGALGLRMRHSAWFVAAALLLPPLNLYLPYRLAEEVVTKTVTPVTLTMLKAWWVCATGWLVLTIVGLTIGSPDPTNTTPLALLSDVLLAASVGAGFVAALLTAQLVHAVDAAEMALSRRATPG